MSQVTPTRHETHLPYGRQSIDDDDIAAVTEVLRSDWLTTGPAVDRFESDFAAATGAMHAVAVANGTAALHTAVAAAGIGPGDEVIVPTLTFAATANSVLFEGARPVFVDVEPDTLLIDPKKVREAITERTRAIIGVDYAGQPCDWDRLHAIAKMRGLTLIADACHSLGGRYHGRSVGTLAHLNAFSFHPVKHMTTAEGGMVTTDDDTMAREMRVFRNHGITTDHRQRAQTGEWRYHMVRLGYNYRLSDVHAALGISQLKRVGAWVERRQALAALYDEALRDLPHVTPLAVREDVQHAYHLYVVRFEDPETRAAAFEAMRAANIGANVHYMPVHLHPYYQENHDTAPGQHPVAEAAADRILSLPLFPAMSDGDVQRVVDVLVALPH